MPGPLPPRHRGHARHAQGGHQQETAGEGDNAELYSYHSLHEPRKII